MATRKSKKKTARKPASKRGQGTTRTRKKAAKKTTAPAESTTPDPAVVDEPLNVTAEDVEAPPETATPAAVDEVDNDFADHVVSHPNDVKIRLTKDAVLGNGQRKRGAVLGSCVLDDGVALAEVLRAIEMPRHTSEVQNDLPANIRDLVVTREGLGDRQVGERLCRIIAYEGVTPRECINALRNPGILA